MGETNPDGSVVDEVVSLADLLHEEPGTDSKFIPITDYIDVAARFLEGFISNTTQTRDLLQRGGLEKLLEFYKLPSLPYNFATSQASQTVCRAINLYCESNLQESLKAIFAASQQAINNLDPLLEHNAKEAFFASFTNSNSKAAAPLPPRLQSGPADVDQMMSEVDSTEEVSKADAERLAVENTKANGTTIVKNLITMHALAYLLQDLYHQSIFNIRQSVQVFLQAQDHDKGGLIVKLGTLQRQCVWEEIQLQKGIPAVWDEITKAKDSTSAIEETIVQSSGLTEVRSETSEQKEAQKAVVEKDGNTSWFRNVKTIRFLIGETPTSINPFLQGMSRLFTMLSRILTDF